MFMLRFAQIWSSFVQADLCHIPTDKIGDVLLRDSNSASLKLLNEKKVWLNGKKGSPNEKGWACLFSRKCLRQ